MKLEKNDFTKDLEKVLNKHNKRLIGSKNGILIENNKYPTGVAEGVLETPAEGTANMLCFIEQI